MQVTLSDGQKVTIRDRFTHKAHKARYQAVNKNVSWQQDSESGEWVKQIPAENIEFQYETVFPLLIEKIESGGKEIPYSKEWLEELLQEDYEKLEDAVASIRNGKTEEREKNTGKAEG